MGGHMEFEFSVKGQAAVKDQQQPFNLLVLGNFSGQRTVEDKGIASRRIRRVDADTLDRLWSELSPRLVMQAGDVTMTFNPRSIDDFHPDQLYQQLPVFTELRAIRQRLLDPATAQLTLTDLLADRGVIEGGLLERTRSISAQSAEDADGMFERLLGKSAKQTAEPQRTSAGLTKLEAFIRGLVAPHIVHEQDPRVDTALQSIELGAAEVLRGILHQPDFQALEASWRSLVDLIGELELDENLRLHVCDIRRDELLAALPNPGSTLGDSDLFQLLVASRRAASDDTPWSVIIGDYFFGPGDEDIALMTALGAAAAANDAIFVAGGRAELLGCRTTAELADARHWSTNGYSCGLWRSLRTSPVADRIGLLLPRVLGRLPYGAGAEEIDAFKFEEIPERVHEHYLWTNPAYACGRLLAQGFSREGWQMEPENHVDLGFLPAHHYIEDGESKLQPCAELLLSEDTMVAMLEQGLMPVVSYRNRNTAVLARFQSIAHPLRRLAGPWQKSN